MLRLLSCPPPSPPTQRCSAVVLGLCRVEQGVMAWGWGGDIGLAFENWEPSSIPGHQSCGLHASAAGQGGGWLPSKRECSVLVLRASLLRPPAAGRTRRPWVLCFPTELSILHCWAPSQTHHLLGDAVLNWQPSSAAPEEGAAVPPCSVAFQGRD